MENTLAILGGRPVFDEMLPINRPTVPELEMMEEEYREVLGSGMLTNDKYLGVRNAVCVSSATSGLILAEKCLGLTGEVIVPSFTFPATTQALLGVYIFGNPPEIDTLVDLAEKYNLKLIFDSAHALGSKYKNRFAGSFGNAEVFSFAPTKIVTSGEGGVITTDDDKLAEDLRIARNYGNTRDYNCRIVGLNARVPEMNAILGLKGIDFLENSVDRRKELVSIYKSLLGKMPGISFQKIADNARTTFKLFFYFC